MTAMVPVVDAANQRRLRFRRALGAYASGVTVITTEVGGEPVGATCQAFHSVSLDPPLVCLALTSASATLAALRTRGRFAVHVLSAEQEQLSRRFGRPAQDKWDGLRTGRTPAGLPRLPDVLLTVDARVHAVHSAGDHDLVLGLVEWFDAAPRSVGDPLLFHRGDYRSVV